jgi:hypothetical protein
VGEPAVPDEHDRAEALALAIELLGLIRNDAAMFPLDDRRTWLLAGTLTWAYEQLAAQREQIGAQREQIEQLEEELGTALRRLG